MEFINGNKFALLDNGVDILYSKIDDVQRLQRPSRPYTLITHNGDLPVNNNHLNILQDGFLKVWYGQNVCIEHPKLKSIPIGLDRGLREEIYTDVLKQDIERNNLFYFRHWGDSMVKDYRDKVRSALVEQGLIQEPKRGITEYLQALKGSMFCPCPNGNGIDTHSLWECIYMGCVPIAEKSINTMFYTDLPILIIDDWRNLPILSEHLYKEIRKKSLEKADFNYWRKIIQG